MRGKRPALVLFFLLSAGAAAPALDAPAETSKAETSKETAGRYSMTPTAEGFLRLDTQTGTVSLCSVANGTAQCRMAVEERHTLETEIERLSKENAELKAKPPEAASGRSTALPSDEEVDKAISHAEKFMRRMLRIMREEASSDKN
jgi:hypothetical protein